MTKQITLKAARVNENLTVEEISKKFDITRQTWRNYENGVTPIPADIFLKFCDMYDFNPKEIKV